MFDFRYHALSLAAVLFALALGILIGVAIGDTNLVSSAKNGIVHDLNAEVSEAHHQTEELQQRLSSEESFAKGLYPLAVHELLNGRNIGLLFLGEPSDQVSSLARASVTQASGNLEPVVAIREPIDVGALASAAVGSHYAALASSPSLLESYGALIGRQLVSGGPAAGRETIGRIRSTVMSAFDGQLTRLEGLIVERLPPDGDQGARQSEVDSRFEDGLLAGVAAAGVPAVGVELTSTVPSQVPWYKSRRISSVDDLDQPAGQAALVYALAGNGGAFGVKPTADSLLPSVPAPG
jgi:hypothetical protein